MRNLIARWLAALDRLRVLHTILFVAVALIVAACNNGSGGTGY